METVKSHTKGLYAAHPHDVDDVLAADSSVVFVVSSAPRRDGRSAGAAATDC